MKGWPCGLRRRERCQVPHKGQDRKRRILFLWKEKFKLGLLPKLLIAIVLGIIIGQFFPVWFCRVVVTASSIFSSFLKFIIPLMIVAYVTMGIADLKSGAGKLLLITVALAYGSTLDRGFGILSGVRKPVPQLHERRRSGTDRRHG